MSDFEEEDFLWETRISPVKRKRKKTPKKDTTCAKHKSHNTTKTEESTQKKKKKKCKDATEKRKEKKKNKKEKKNKLPVGLDHSFVSTQGCTFVPNSSAKSKPRSTERKNPDDPTQEDSKNSKRKKKVAWDLPQQRCIRVKRPQFVSSTPRDNNQSAEEGAVSYRQAAETTMSQQQDNDSQCTGEDINSQDLFITQKTFRPSSPCSEPSSGETSNKGVFITTQEEGANIHRQQSHLKKVKEPQRPKTTRRTLKEEEEEERLDFMLQNPKSETLPFQKQMDLNQNVKVHVKPSVVNLYLNKPVVLSQSKSKPDARSPGRRSPSHPQNAAEPSLLLQVLKANISTQTENFFTAELCSFFTFCQKKKKATTSSGSESWKPLDLSLPQRVRRDVARCVVTEIEDDEAERSDKKTSTPPLDEMMKDAAHRESSRRPSCSSEMEVNVKAKKDEPSRRSRLSVGSRSKGKTTPSPQSESEAKSLNSSEDSEPPSSTGKPDLTQVRAVQMRLNESFFFKTKGEGRGARPESPLMKLSQGQEKKSRKSH